MGYIGIFIIGLLLGFIACALVVSAKQADKIIENKNKEWEADEM